LDSAGLGRDVVINSVRYPLVTDKNGLSWRHEDDIALGNGRPWEPVLKAWETGFAGGMGETQQFIDGSDGYAFCAGWDATKPGRVKLSGRRATATPASSPVDFMTNGWIAAPVGGFVTAVGNFVTVADTDPHTITHGLSVAIEGAIFWTSGKTASGTVGAGTYNSVGITDGTTSRAASWISEDNVATGNVQRQWANGCIALMGYTAVGPIASISNITATTFDITFDSAPAADIIVHFQVFGGADISAKVIAWTQPSAPDSAYEITGVGFQPTTAIHITAGTVALGAGPVPQAIFGLGAMDSAGNQWATSIYGEEVSPSNTRRAHLTTAAHAFHGAGGTLTNSASYVSMDIDGFTLNFTAASAAVLAASLCLTGLQVKAGSFTKATSATTQAAQTIGFTTTGFFLASVGLTTLATVSDHALVALGAASGTTAVEASCWSDEDAQNPTDTYAVDDNALAFEILDPTDGSEDNLATCANISMEVAGWLTWSAADANADYISYLAFAPSVTADSFVYITNGQRVYKLSVSGTTITVEEIKDHGNAAVAGGNALFLGDNYLALGADTAFSALTTVAQSGSTDTWTADASGDTSLAFARQQDGGTAKLLRGHTIRLADLSTDGATWTADDYQVGETSSAITNMVDTGTSAYVSKTDGLYRFVSEGVTQKIIESQPDPDNGCGLLGLQGTDAVLYNDTAGLWFFDGANLPTLIGPDANDLNQPINAITHVPRGGRHYETAKVGKWFYSVYRVTESTVKTYILAGFRTGQRWTWHTVWRYDGVVRGVVPDDSGRLWHVWPSEGLLGYHQLDEDGCPDPGRNTIGHGAASTTYDFVLPDVLFLAKTYLHSIEVLLTSTGGSTPLQFQYQVDNGNATNIGGPVISSGLSRVFKGTTAVGGYRWRLIASVTTTAADDATYPFDPDDLSPVTIRAIRAYFWTRPQKSDRIHFTVDCGKPLSSGAMDSDPKARRDALKALARGDTSGPAVTCLDPDGGTLYLGMFRAADEALREVDGELHWVMDCVATEWTTASQ
jgi:hypothetical protein